MQNKQAPMVDQILSKLRFYQVPMIVSAVCIGLFVMAWMQYSELSIIFSDIDKSRNELDAVNRKIAFLAEQDPQTLARNKDLVNKALPVEKPVLATVTGLRNVAERVGVDIIELTSNPGQISTASATPTAAKAGAVTSNVSLLRVEMRIEGDLLAINEYLLTVSQMLPLVGLESVNISLAGTPVEGGEQRYGLDLAVQVYWMPRKEATVKTGDLKSVNGLSVDAVDALDVISGFEFYGIDL